MATITNLGFESGNYGIAFDWQILAVQTTEEYAGYLYQDNRCLQSTDFSGFNWTLTNVTVATNVASSPLEGVTDIVSDRVSETVTNGLHELIPFLMVPAGEVGRRYTASVYAKADGGRYIGLSWYDSVTFTSVYFIADLLAGTVHIPATHLDGKWSDARVRVEDVGGGWYRLSLSATMVVFSTDYRMSICLSDGASLSYAGNTANRFLLTAAQMTGAGSPGRHIRTIFNVASQEKGYEDFEEFWDATDDFFDSLTDIEFAQYLTLLAAKAVEDFEEFWDSNHEYVTQLSLAEQAAYDTVPESAEDFEEEWDSNEGYLFALSSVAAAAFDDEESPEDFEDFEDDWFDGSYVFALGSVSEASYDGANPQDFEDFEDCIAPILIAAADPSTDTITTSGDHEFDNGAKVRIAGATLPLGFVGDNDYYVISATSNTLQLSATSGGSAVDFTSPGGGPNYLHADQSLFWTQFITTV